jgi:iron complex outermembrane receptor protein
MRTSKSNEFAALFARRVAVLAGAAGALTLSAVNVAAAQTTAPAAGAQNSAASEPIDIVVVTGTSLKGSAPVGTQVQVLGADDLRATGVANTNEILKSVPQVVNLGQDEGRGGGVQGAQGNITQSKTINLRGIGTESTLVLLNGRRIAPAGTQGAGYDVSMIPSNAVARIEVVADGASAIYGSEAVGGVINFITKRDYQGGETYLRYGFADGFDEQKFGQNFGYAWESGEVFFAYERYQRGGLMGYERNEVTQDLRPIGGPDLRLNFASPGTITVGAQTYATPLGTRGVGLSAGQFIAGTANLEDINDTRSLLVDQEQDVALLSVRQEITGGLTVWVEGQYSDRDYDGFGTSLNRGAGSATLTVPRSNPFFVHPTNPAATSVSVNYSFSDAFPWKAHGGEEAFGGSAGLTYELPGDWSLDLMASRTGNDSFRRADQVWSANLPAILADSNPATAFNPFCDTSAFTDCNNPATLDRLRGYNIIAARYRSDDFVAKASGSLFDLPGGSIGLAVGGEFMKPDLVTTITQLTTTTNVAVRETKTDREVKAGFAELLVPIFGSDNALPGLQKLDLSAAVRVEEFSDFGSTTNPKYGLTWKPLDSLTLRGSYGTSFRAPTLTNIDFAATATYSAVTILDPSSNSQIRVIQLLGARPGLEPETADTLTFGVDFAPAALPGLRTSLTYYDIDYTNRISSLSSTTILANPTVYADYLTRNPSADLVTSYMTSVFYRTVPESPANIVAIVDARTANLGGLKQSGLDGMISYDFSLLNSEWNIGASATKILKAEQSAAERLPFIDVLDQINNPVSFRARGHIGWSYGSASVDAFINHVGSYDNTLRTPVEKIDSWTTLDLSLAYETPRENQGWGSGLRFALSLINATDSNPPRVINTTTAVEGFYDPQNASVTGRFVAFEVSKQW